ncbi:unnamed protein product [Nippostrongylus brasiliensis]|uniref:PI-PLC Y-box domain-containing protein n=1 Tax=Nippostrongylus brasiliensis TaxID=27835 RepID=A0A0N4Y5K4_NIPBR|nr:unnamed protein product [Nippostrongylus brasiliensis]
MTMIIATVNDDMRRTGMREMADPRPVNDGMTEETATFQHWNDPEMGTLHVWNDLTKSEPTSFDSVPGEGVHPLSGGISIPQHIVIPPSMGERGPDGNPLPQKFQINSEITINYDGKNVTSTPQSDQNEPYRRRYPVSYFIVGRNSTFSKMWSRNFADGKSNFHIFPN